MSLPGFLANTYVGCHGDGQRDGEQWRDWRRYCHTGTYKIFVNICFSEINSGNSIIHWLGLLSITRSMNPLKILPTGIISSFSFPRVLGVMARRRSILGMVILKFKICLFVILANFHSESLHDMRFTFEILPICEHSLAALIGRKVFWVNPYL